MILPLLISLLPIDPPLESAQATPQQLLFFEKEVRPLLDTHCFKCHGPSKQWAGLRLDSREALLNGGDSGPAVVPGDPDSSLLVKAIRHDDENLQMPQDEKLGDLQIAALVKWVQLGVPFPANVPESERKRDPDHWAFQPIPVETVPDVQNTEWPINDVDRFILARLAAAGLSPADRADKRTLIRRVTFDLTGLPPTPEEIDEFLSDDSDRAYHALIERLLASAAYGEHWGRHWLDVARYADSNGLDENVAFGNAWRYRDYVVQSFNADKPFDQFVVEQLAGDLLDAPSTEARNEYLIATGFLSIGPKVLAEVNMPKMRMDIVDEQIDTVGRVFMGMTFGCARCHDHKFDPIQTADYYGLAGIFKSTRTMETYTKVAKWHEHPLKTAEAEEIQADYDAQLLAAKQAVEALVMKADESARKTLANGDAGPESLESLYSESTREELAKLREAVAAIEKTPPELPAAMGVLDDVVADVAIHLRGNPSRLGDLVPRHLPSVMAGAKFPAFTSEQSGRLEMARWLVDPGHPLTARVLVNRFWRWHFGEGLVRSTDNFGLLGDRPSHPELLNWLAARFIQDGWSLKAFHRLILTSSVYQQGSVQSPAAANADPENLLWSRMPVRRLTAEEVRDSLLSVSGQLDSTMGGSLLKVKNRGYLFDHTSIDTTDYNSSRRSLYLPVIRNNVFDMFQLLDFPDPAVPTGDRATTTVAPQALMMMNSDFVMQAADKLAERIRSRKTDADRVMLLYQLTLGRFPADHELADDLKLLQLADDSLCSSVADPVSRRLQAWSVVCQTVLASSEFLYVQ